MQCYVRFIFIFQWGNYIKSSKHFKSNFVIRKWAIMLKQICWIHCYYDFWMMLDFSILCHFLISHIVSPFPPSSLLHRNEYEYRCGYGYTYICIFCKFSNVKLLKLLKLIQCIFKIPNTVQYYYNFFQLSHKSLKNLSFISTNIITFRKYF